MDDVPEITGVGSAHAVTGCEVEAVHPLASVTITPYVAVAVTTTVCVVAPVVQA